MAIPIWPVLRRYAADHLRRIALPLGGIGTGTVSLGGRGDLRDWEVMNRPAKGFVPRLHGRVGPFFALYARAAGGRAAARVLEGPLDTECYEGSNGVPGVNHGLPRFRRATFAAAYPLGQVCLSDPAVPLRVTLQAFNPLVPCDLEASSWPAAVLRVGLHNPSRAPVAAAVCGSLPNFIGQDGGPIAPGMDRNRNLRRAGPGLRGILMVSRGLEPACEQNGTLALATTARGPVTHRLAWRDRGWGSALLDFWDDFAADGRLEPRPFSARAATAMASLAVSLVVPPRGTRAVVFLITWHFPNRYSWTRKAKDAGPGRGITRRSDWIGNHYTTRFRDAWDVAARLAPRLPGLERRTLVFVSSFCRQDLPAEVKEATLFNLSTLRSQTCFRTPDGRFFGFEGCGDHQGCCLGSCTHVWNYEQAVPFLFGGLARSMREVEFRHATDRRGLMSFRVHLPLRRAREFGKAAADGQMGCLLKLYRDWQLSGDDAWLRRLWPAARRALAFCWTPGGWDADADGVMEGCQHNTMDVEYYGPNPQMQGWYLGALRAAEEIAGYLGEAAFADRCRRLFERGRAWMDAHLFNGAYYEQRVQSPGRHAVAAGLRLHTGARVRGTPAYQLGAGCLVDQLAGQVLAHVCGLGYLHDPRHVRRTLRSIWHRNRRASLHAHFNCMRSYALGDEAALLMAAYPKTRPANPFPYFTEVMTGFEYTAAVGMLYEGLIPRGLQVIRDVRARYDGRKRNPFDEAECGHHYARAMIAWAALLALAGFQYSAVSRRLALSAWSGTRFWSTGYAWGEVCQTPAPGGARRLVLRVLGGVLPLRALEIARLGRVVWPRTRRLRAGARVSVTVRPAPRASTAGLSEPGTTGIPARGSPSARRRPAACAPGRRPPGSRRPAPAPARTGPAPVPGRA